MKADFNIDSFNDRAKRSSISNKKLFAKLKRTKPKDLDAHTHRFHEEAFAHTDCLQCANCCKTTSPIFYQKDLERAAAHLRMKPGDFLQKYLHMDEDGDFVLNVAPCPFLDAENHCSIYDSRPTACREYPHTDRKKVYQVLDITEKNALICPAVLEITERLKKIYLAP